MTFSTLLMLAAVTLGAEAKVSGAPDGSRWWSHVAFLADDKLQGRDTGSPGHKQAALYVAHQFELLGLQPAGTKGYLQPVRFRSKRIDESRTRVSLKTAGGEHTVVLGDEALVSLRIDPAAKVEAPLVFVGHGLSSPEAGIDDFAGLNVAGKVVVVLLGAPANIPGPLAAHLQSAGERGALLRKLGAVGLIAIQNPKNMDIPWDRASLARFLPAMSLGDPALDDNRGLLIGLTVNPARADLLFAGTDHTIHEILALADTNQPLPHFEIPARLKAEVAVDREELESDNVVAILPGTDPQLKNESVVFTAHLDHVGVGKPIKGDSIHNGAMDNASGVAALLDVAAILRDQGIKLRRSVVFLAVTGEEKGLLGSRYFALNPTVDPKGIVANLNTDMFLPLFPLKTLTVYGLDESDLGGDIRAVASTLGIATEPDPEPKRNIFIRSDQYSFIRQGVPALAFKVGFAKGSHEEEVAHRWLTERYHAPSDDLSQPVDKACAGEFDLLMARMLERVANRDTRPTWNANSFFRRFAR